MEKTGLLTANIIEDFTWEMLSDDYQEPAQPTGGVMPHIEPTFEDSEDSDTEKKDENKLEGTGSVHEE